MFENRYGSTDTFKMATDQRKMRCGIAPNLRHRGTMGAPSIFDTLTLVRRHFDLGDLHRFSKTLA